MSTLSESDRAALREEVKREVKEEIHREEKSRRVRRAVGCLSVYFVFLGIPLILLAVLLTRAGMMRLPLVTASLYHPVAPTRVVAPLVGETAEVAWREAIASAKYVQSTNQMTIQMDENRLTTIIRAGFENQASALPFKASDAQAALDRDRVELFFNTERGGAPVPVRLVFLPTVDPRGDLLVNVTEITVGGAEVPAALRAPMVKLLNNFLRTELLSQMPEGFILRSFDVQKENLSISFTAPLR